MEDASAGFALADWSAGEFIFGNNALGDRPFRGEILGVAIYNRCFTLEEAKTSSRRMPVDNM
jgi:hypothetical protein